MPETKEVKMKALRKIKGTIPPCYHCDSRIYCWTFACQDLINYLIKHNIISE